MEIVWLGGFTFRIKGKESLVLTDPTSPHQLKLGSRQQPSVITLSGGLSEGELLKGSRPTGKVPFVVDGPGEYEVAGVLVLGIATNGRYPKAGQPNTAYLIEIDELTTCHLGRVHSIIAEESEPMSNCNVLMVPISGGDTLDVASAVETTNILEPNIVIPMGYEPADAPADAEPLRKFLKEMGLKEPTPLARLSVTKSTLPAEPTVVVLEPARQG